MSKDFIKGFLVGMTAFGAFWLMINTKRNTNDEAFSTFDTMRKKPYAKDYVDGQAGDARRLGGDMYAAMSQYADKKFGADDRPTTH